MEQRITDSSMVETTPAGITAYTITNELLWLSAVLDARARLNVGDETGGITNIYEVEPPKLSGDNGSPYSRFVNDFELGFSERLLLALSMAPHINPELLDVFLLTNQNTGQVFSEFGGKKGKTANGFLPTFETFLFIIAGQDVESRFAYVKHFGSSHFFWTNSVLESDSVDPCEPYTSFPITIAHNYLEYFTLGTKSKPRYGVDFPAKLLNTPLEWSDLVLEQDTMEGVEYIQTWVQHNSTLVEDWGMNKHLRPGFRALFYGPPGTGKTLTASVLGKQAGLDVYRIDLSKIISKYIGETAKNLARIFDEAEKNQWILFFDEADSLFGKRTQINDSHDRYANQEISFLLQRLEDYAGLTILATNLRSNIDEAFARRFQSIIHFPIPDSEHRYKLWKQGFSDIVSFDANVDFKQIASKYEMSGGVIMNVIQYASLMALRRGGSMIRNADILNGIKLEYKKYGRTV